jgi:hypothetical protein
MTTAARDTQGRILARRAVVLAVVVLQVALVLRAYWSDHDELGFQMFPESSTWQADVVRVTDTGERVPVDDPWPGGYRWEDLVRLGGLRYPAGRHHADAGVDSQLAFLSAALDWVAANTPADAETAYLEAVVTYCRNVEGPFQRVLRSHERDR